MFAIRIEGINNAVSRLEGVQENYFEMATELVGKNKILYKVSASKFLDFIPRTTETQVLKILKIKSNDCISIGKYKSSQNEICLALVDLEKEFQNKICGHYLSELEGELVNNFSWKISVSEVHLNE